VQPWRKNNQVFMKAVTPNHYLHDETPQVEVEYTHSCGRHRR